MTAPPKHIPASRLFQQLTQSKPSRLVPFPRQAAEGEEPFPDFPMVLLSEKEATEVSTNAEIKTRRILKENCPSSDEMTSGANSVYNHFAAHELLFRACRDPEDPSRSLFPNQQAVADVLTADEMAVLLRHYGTLQVELGPVIADMTDAELEAWISRLAEGGRSSQYFLNSLSWEAAKGLLIALAARSQSLPQDNNSSSLPPEENMSEEPKPKTKRQK